MSTLNTRIEEKLYQNRYVVDAGKPHIKVKEHEVPSEALKSLVTTCPANCYSETGQGKVEIVPDGCMECGTCRVVRVDTDEIEWDYPRGGYGVLYKFG
jgi:ferredoxin like protein